MGNFPVHGGNVYEVASRLHCQPEEILDYSASINPLGPPPGLREEFLKHFDRLQHYPDIHNQALVEDLAVFHGLGRDQVVVGNGSTELIYWLPRILELTSALMVLPTFSEYQRAFEIQGVKLAKLFTRAGNGFQPTVEELARMVEKHHPEAILVTHPGSPAGSLLSQDVREWLLRIGVNEGRYCIVDEAFIDFCEGDSFKRHLSETPRLILLRSMTKFYGIPGVRVGYLLTSPGMAKKMSGLLPPWSVSTLAQIAGSFCLKQKDYQQATLKLVAEERSALEGNLGNQPGFQVFPGRANYLLAHMEPMLPTAKTLREHLLQQDRILIRDGASFDGLGERYFRVAVRLPEQNRRLSAALERWCRTVTA
ncbi:MAG TPA: threonine-phosphate decarboxylase [Syntrophobacteraceae bacterium]|nr:threonine-phosphate decarboxylase [Syntrophobacteraceae bacterium]